MEGGLWGVFQTTDSEAGPGRSEDHQCPPARHLAKHIRATQAPLRFSEHRREQKAAQVACREG